MMSPWEVVARMSSSAVPSFLRALLMRPWPVPASRAAETPAAAPTVMSPDCVRSTTVPRAASVIRMSPLAVLISAGPLSRPTSTSPSIAVRRTLAASSILIWRYAPSKATSPRRPTPRSSALAALASMREPAGSWTVTSRDPEGPKSWLLEVEAVIRRTPSA